MLVKGALLDIWHSITNLTFKYRIVSFDKSLGDILQMYFRTFPHIFLIKWKFSLKIRGSWKPKKT